MTTQHEATEPAAPELGDSEALGTRTSRRRLLQAGLVGATALGLAGCMSDDDEPSAAATGASTTGGSSSTASGSSILDKWTRDKTAKLGVDLSFPPLQFKDDSGKATGYQIEITEMMMKELGVTPEYVETPFAQLFPGLVGREVRHARDRGDDPPLAGAPAATSPTYRPSTSRMSSSSRRTRV